MINITLLASALSLAPAGTFANPAPMTETTQVVRYDDLDLASAEGQSQLDRRILSAARRVCDERRVPSAAQQARISACVATARSRARNELDELAAARKIGTPLTGR